MTVTTNKGVNAPVRDAGDVHVTLPTGYINSEVRVWQDRVQIAASEVGSKIYLADLPWDLKLLPDLCKIHFDDAGTSVTLDIGDASNDDSLAADIDIATAAGSSSMMPVIDRSNYGKPLWQILGYATRAAAVATGAKARVYATIAGATTGASIDFYWCFAGTV